MIYVLEAITDRNTGLLVGVLGLIYATIRLMFLNQGHAFMLLANGLEDIPAIVDRKIATKHILRGLTRDAGVTAGDQNSAGCVHHRQRTCGPRYRCESFTSRR